MNPKIFREYDIRGIADKDLTSPVVENIGRAIGTFVRKNGGTKISLGRDCRLSSSRLREAILAGVLSTGVDVVDIGLVPTPLSYYSVFELNLDGAVMITGSHNPGEHNGFKISVGRTTIHGEDIQKIRQMIEEKDFVTGKGTLTSQEVIERYTNMVVKNVTHPLKLKVVVDSGNGMAGGVIGNLMRKLGCDVTELYSELDGSFPNHHPDPTVLENMRFLVKAVKETKADVGIGFDGDADRIGVVDPTGQQIYGDELLVLYSRDILAHHKGAKIISEVKASHRLFEDIASHGGIPILWKTGHSLIKAKMKEERALLAGEMSGHMFFNDRYYGYDDAIYAAARLVEILAKEKKTPVQLLSDLPPSFTTPEIRVDCSDEIKFQVVKSARETFEKQGLKVNGIDGARVEYPDGWGLVRASNTQPVLVFRFEATSEKRLNEIRQSIEGVVEKLIQECR